MMKPAITALSPMSTRMRVDRFSAWAGVGVGLGVGVGVGVGVAVGVGVGVGAASSSTIVTVVVCGVPTPAPATALREAVKVSFPSDALSFRIVITTGLLVSPTPKFTSPELAV